MGVVCYDADFYPYGGERSYTNTCPQNNYKFEGKERDVESGNDYAMARYNINRLGRFSSPDLLPGTTADPQSLNRYTFVLNDPLNLIDPLGLCPRWGPFGVNGRVICTSARTGFQGPDSGDATSFGGSCAIDGTPAYCGSAFSLLRDGVGVVCRNNDCTGIRLASDGILYQYKWVQIDNASYGYLCNGETGPAGFPSCTPIIFSETEQGWALVPVGRVSNLPGSGDPSGNSNGIGSGPGGILDLLPLIKAQEHMEVTLTNRILLPGAMIGGGLVVAGSSVIATVAVCSTVVGCLASPITLTGVVGGLVLAGEGAYYGIFQKFYIPPSWQK